MSKTILAIHAHPDDESSKGAATVSKYVSQGERAVLVTATGGEAGDILNPEMDTPEVSSKVRWIRSCTRLPNSPRLRGSSDMTTS